MVLTIGTDCSGIEAPIEALRQLNIPFEHKWACEIDAYARESIQANYHPQTMFDDIIKRNHKQLPDVDMYVCGFPCQPFSLLGRKQGTLDDRSNIMLHCIQVIKHKLPSIFILENVKNFKHIQDGVLFKYLLRKLTNFKQNGATVYDVHVDVLNTKDYGIPQNRERVYIIGMKKTHNWRYSTPPKTPTKPLEDFLLSKRVYNIQPKANARKVIKRTNLNMNDNNVIACAGYGNYMTGMCPTITSSTPIYLTKYKRYLTPQELLLLQGFRRDFVQVVSDHQLRRQAGNSMSVNVLVAIFKVLFND